MLMCCVDSKSQYLYSGSSHGQGQPAFWEKVLNSFSYVISTSNNTLISTIVPSLSVLAPFPALERNRSVGRRRHAAGSREPACGGSHLPDLIPI